MNHDDLTPWEQKEIEDVRQARGLPSPSDVVWDDSGNEDEIVKPASSPYPPPYDPGSR